ncbi:MAG: hypothetical protein KC572_14635 [Gammaproteobacteria bacterium]|nr:hypothetical protein [Gammaproteobacteria bacterium]
MQDLPIPIFRAKLYPPPMAPDTIQRQRLLSLAHSVVQSPLTLLSAPAGYGKSTLVSQWLESLGCKSTWLSLGTEDSDFRQFLSYVIAALRSVKPDSFTVTAGMLQPATLPGTKKFAGTFCNEFEVFEGPIALVLDDFHHISSSEIDDFLDRVLRHPPRNLHLIIVSRRDPALSISSLRVKGALCEVRMRQLAFREDETRTFIRAKLDHAITENEIAILQERTEGWPAALRLASLAAVDPGSTASLIDQLPEDSQAVRTYLLQEVLANQSSEIRELLLRIAFLDQFCAELCESLMPDRFASISGRDLVHHISQANLFSIGLDARDGWYRFHHLFQAMLQDQAVTDLGNEAIRDIHLHASTWFEQHGFLTEAIRHALRADRADTAADVISRHRNEIMNHERWHQLSIWLRLLPPMVIESRPDLQLLKARVFRTTGQNTELVQTLDHVESLLDAADIDSGIKSELHGSLASMRCSQFYVESDGEGAVGAARRALELLPPDDLAERGFAMIILAVALQMSGDVNQAKSTIYAAMADFPADGDDSDTYTTRLLAALFFIQWMDADLKGLDLVARQTVEISTRADLWEVLSCAVHMQAAVHYQTNNLSAVEGDLREFFHKKSIASAEFYAQSLVISALASEVLGNSEDAHQVAESLHELAFRTGNPYLIGLSEALAAELAMRRGHMAEALKWASQYQPEPFVPMYAFFSPQLCLAKILVLDDSVDSRERAQAYLPRLEEYLARIHNKRFLIETLALRALLSDKTGDTGRAVEQLGSAVALAQPGDFIRLFVDIGPGLLPLLSRLELKGEKLEYVGRILAAFQSQSGQADAVQTDTKFEVTIKDIAGLPENLSPREKEVLALLVERLTNKEIGGRLFISTATVKRHAHSIYEKLNVKGRREAVAKAIELGLIID